jgi:H/ACA ribonucleoprotein complex subunit 2
LESKKDDFAVRHRSKLGKAVFATPLAESKVSKKVLKLVKKAAKAKAIRRGIKEVSKALRKDEKGILVLAANITPVDVISHLPMLCEEKNIPYVFVSAKEDLGPAGLTKRPCSCILVRETGNDSFKDKYTEAETLVNGLTE